MRFPQRALCSAEEDGMFPLEEFDAEGIFINSDNNITVTDGLKDRFTRTSRDYTLVS